MIFFAFLGLVTLIAWFLDKVGVPTLGDWSARMRFGLSVAMLFFGLDHLLTPERYIPMIKSFIPFPYAIVVFTGLCEIAGGLGLFLPRIRRLAGIMLAVYFLCVFPANIANALNGLSIQELPEAQTYYWIRLGFQPLAIWWALVAGNVIGLRPYRSRKARST